MNNPFKYTGEIQDDESGLIYLRARYYDPSVHRFITEDTYEGKIDNPLSLNLYTYVTNNPLIYIDPSGMCGVKSWGDAGDCFALAGKKMWYDFKHVDEGIVDTANFLVVDDVKTILDPKASTFDKGLALGGFIPVGKVFKGGRLIIKLANQEGRIIERAVNFTGSGVEKTLDSTLKSYEQARNLAMDIVGDLGKDSKAVYGRLPSSAGNGKIVGRQSADGKLIWRLDYDPNKGMHINIEDYRNGKGNNATKLVIPFEGNEETFKSLLKHLQ
jgi:RHS repeat-associated protein